MIRVDYGQSLAYYDIKSNTTGANSVNIRKVLLNIGMLFYDYFDPPDNSASKEKFEIIGYHVFRVVLGVRISTDC